MIIDNDFNASDSGDRGCDSTEPLVPSVLVVQTWFVDARIVVSCMLSSHYIPMDPDNMSCSNGSDV